MSSTRRGAPSCGCMGTGPLRCRRRSIPPSWTHSIHSEVVMQRAAVVGGGGIERRALRALRGRGIDAVALPSGADALAVLDALRGARADTAWLPEPLCSE